MDNLIEILRDALQAAISRPGILRFPAGDYQDALSLLSDRSALLWALLEEEAGEVVEEYTEDLWSQGFRIGKDAVLLQSNKTEGKPDSLHPLRGYITDGKSFILCLARAIQEQRKRESGVQDKFPGYGCPDCCTDGGCVCPDPQQGIESSRQERREAEVSGE